MILKMCPASHIFFSGIHTNQKQALQVLLKGGAAVNHVERYARRIDPTLKSRIFASNILQPFLDPELIFGKDLLISWVFFLVTDFFFLGILQITYDSAHQCWRTALMCAAQGGHLEVAWGTQVTQEGETITELSSQNASKVRFPGSFYVQFMLPHSTRDR